jgi:flavin reductase (DIM6/NTAB) family NADH-FMN oxidoreductase RutF
VAQALSMGDAGRAPLCSAAVNADDAPGVGPDAHRAAARLFASGVTVAAASWRGRSHAITATAFCSLSLEPPLVLLAVRRSSQLLALVDGSGCLGVSVLGAHQRHIGEWAASRGRPLERDLPANATTTAVTGAPLVPDALAWFDCRVRSRHEHGDHTVIIGLVVATHSAGGTDPLVYFSGDYHGLGPRVGSAPLEL